jgi:hypothetical protein
MLVVTSPLLRTSSWCGAYLRLGNTVTCILIARQRLGKHIPAIHAYVTIGRLLLGKAAVNTLFNNRTRCFSWGLYRGYMENTVFYCWILLCYLATCCSTVHRKHSSYCCVFVGTCILSRCLAMCICVTIYMLSFSYLQQSMSNWQLQLEMKPPCSITSAYYIMR